MNPNTMIDGTPQRDGQLPQTDTHCVEELRLQQAHRRIANWQRWGPYLAERQWGTVREDYSANGDPWSYFTHDHARSRAYRWGEDGLLGICDRECRLCFAIALWNGKDPILKERLFGLSGPEGNHGEDVKECYYYLDSTPTHSYMKALYKYPQAEFPYERLLHENRKRGRDQPEFELIDTGIFDDNRYFDVFLEYAKKSPNDILIRITIHNRAAEAASLHVLPTLWFRNMWDWGCTHERLDVKPVLKNSGDRIDADHPTLGRFQLMIGPHSANAAPVMLFTENETNTQRLFQSANKSPYVKDAFHNYLVHGKADAVNPMQVGTKAAVHYTLQLDAQSSAQIQLRLFAVDEAPSQPFGADFEQTFRDRNAEADAFYAQHLPGSLGEDERNIARQALAGLLWTKQFYHYAVREWLDGDPGQPSPPPQRRTGRNHKWKHLFNRDVISMPDKWEYPWYAAWDLAFHMIPFAKLDPEFAKKQLILFLREWYMHPNGQMSAYEFALSDVNPPVHAWACWRVYKKSAARGQRDRIFLERVFHKLLLNFTWWVNRKDADGENLFSGGFLGLDNIGVFDRSQPLPGGGSLKQADGTAWMAFFCGTMLSIALELAREDPIYEDVASKFFEHFVAIAEAMNTAGGNGLWDEQDGFYYDQLRLNGWMMPLRTRSIVGLVPLFAVEILEDHVIDRLHHFKKRMNWFLEHRREVAPCISYMETDCGDGTSRGQRLLAIPSRQRLRRILDYLLDENEFLSPYGIRSLSKFHEQHPYVLRVGGEEHRVGYVPGESNSGFFGGNSNWRGPIWMPMNFLIIEALERYHHFYRDNFKVEFPTGSGNLMNLQQIADELACRLCAIFRPGPDGKRPCHGDDQRYHEDPHWRELLLFHEYFHGDNGRGLGASHQTGWTALVVPLMEAIGGKKVMPVSTARATRVAMR